MYVAGGVHEGLDAVPRERIHRCVGQGDALGSFILRVTRTLESSNIRKEDS